MSPIAFKAPWSRKLKIGTAVYSLVFCAFAVAGVVFGFKQQSTWQLALILLPVLGLALASLSTVRGYTLTEKDIEVTRLLWKTHLPLDGLRSIEGNVAAMDRAIVFAGNQGFFSYSGYFWSRAVGFFRALATDPSRAVVLRYATRKVVVTPHDPQQLIMRVRTLLKVSAFPR